MDKVPTQRHKQTYTMRTCTFAWHGMQKSEIRYIYNWNPLKAKSSHQSDIECVNFSCQQNYPLNRCDVHPPSHNPSSVPRHALTLSIHFVHNNSDRHNIESRPKGPCTIAAKPSQASHPSIHLASQPASQTKSWQFVWKWLRESAFDE